MHAMTKPEVEHVKCYAAGEWIDSTDRIEVYNPYTNQLVGTVPKLSARQVGEAVAALAAYKPKLSAHQRAEILYKAAQGVKARKEELALGITMESGMSPKNSRVEVARTCGLLLTASVEAKRIKGE